MSKKVDCKVKKGLQISIAVQDERGILSRITSLLGDEGLNIYALTLTGGIDHGDIRIVVDQHELAMNALNRAGYLVFEREVILLEIPNEAGALGAVSSLWAEAGVNMEYAYCAGGPSVQQGMVVLRVDDTDTALAVLEEQ